MSNSPFNQQAQPIIRTSNLSSDPIKTMVRRIVRDKHYSSTNESSDEKRFKNWEEESNN